jgi:3-vinyl bacteriochlorophyllide hydratase
MDPIQSKATRTSAPLYTPEQRRRRDASVWTQVQGVLAIVQFLVFLISLALVLHYLLTGTGWQAATVSILCKTVALYSIMITGSLWEHDVYGRYLLAPAFFWEDMVSFVVIGLHTAYLIVLFTGALDARGQMLLALAAYSTYAINAAQFILKLRRARLEPRAERSVDLSADLSPARGGTGGAALAATGAE